MPHSRFALTLLALASLLASTPSPIHPQIASLVRDLDPAAVGGEGSRPHDFVTVGRRAVFTAFEPSSGWELWATDGTPAGTELLADASPGAGAYTSSPPPFYHRDYVHLDERILVWFQRTAQPSRPFARLWRTDGTRAGTRALSPDGREPILGGAVYLPDPGILVFLAITPDGRLELWRSDAAMSDVELVTELDEADGPSLAYETEMAAARGQVFFWSPSGPLNVAPRALWASDGTAAGTRRLLVPPEDRKILRDTLAAAGDRGLFLLHDTARFQNELWSSDGTADGTGLIRTFRPQVTSFPPTFVVPSNLMPLGDRVLFVADDRVHDFELWTSDGTAAGTRRITDVPGPFPILRGGLRPEQVVELDGALLFTAESEEHGYELWRTDGTPGSTRVIDLCPGPCSGLGEPYAASGLLEAGGRAFFAASDRGTEPQLWTSDGTRSGTFRASRSCPGGCAGVRDLASAGGEIYFVADRGSRGAELWHLVDADLGTVIPVTDFTFPDPFANLARSGAGTWIGTVGDRLVVPADDGRHGTEPWVVGPTPESAALLADVAVEAAGSLPRSSLPMGELDGAVFFVADAGTGPRLWTSRGSLATTIEVPTPGCASWQGFVAAGGAVFFLCGQPFVSRGLWRSDGTAAGTFEVLGFAPGATLSSLRMVAFGEELYFALYEPPGFTRVWASDGTPSGTRPVFTVPSALFLAAAGGRLFVAGADLGSGGSLWGSDGAPGSQVELARFGPGRRILHVAGAGEAAVFDVEDMTGPGGSELWGTDGTPEGTVLLRDLGQAAVLGMISTEGQSWLLVASYGPDRLTLWRSDGTPDGTAPVTDVGRPAPVGGFHSGDFTAAGERLFFVAEDPAAGVELWASDGTAEGTAVVRDLFPGIVSSLPRDLAAAGGRLFFAATDGVHGLELFTSDGTAEGTRLVHDVAPGPLSSLPESLTPAIGRLFFSADDGLSGRELWSLPLDPAEAGCHPADTSFCAGGRFRLEVAARTADGASWTGRTVPLSADTGAFWLFDRDNLETATKVLDGRGLNGHFWVFHGALTDVEHHLTVTDAETGLTRRYHHPSGRFASAGDILAFGPLGTALESFTPPGQLRVGRPSVARGQARASASGCAPSAERLCLLGGRFAVEARWRDFHGRTGAALAVPVTAESGAFWFFDRDNVEILVKVLDGTAFNGRTWVFYGALTNVELTLTVTDTATGATRTYFNPAGTFASVGDVDAF